MEKRLGTKISFFFINRFLLLLYSFFTKLKNNLLLIKNISPLPKNEKCSFFFVSVN